MATGTSSARYEDLYHYARTAEAIDQELIAQADKLINRLSYFEATCREPGFQVSSDGLGSALRSHGTRAVPVEQQVRKVGEAFRKADGQANSFLGRVALDPVGRWIFKALRPATLSVADNELGLDFVYTVKKGDTLSKIAKRFGITLDDILRENPITNRDLIHPGLKLVIPGAPPVQKPEPFVGPWPIPQPVPTPEKPVHEGKPDWIVDRVKISIGRGVEQIGLSPGQKPNQETKIPYLSQHSPESDPTNKDFLFYKRYDLHTGVERTVEKDISYYGCLMTCYVMLMRGKGYDVRVTDLYKYRAKTVGSIDDENRKISTENMRTAKTTVNEFMKVRGINSSLIYDSISGDSKAEREKSLREWVESRGPVVLHVTGRDEDGHWIVIAGVNPDGSFIVYDPDKSPSSWSEYTFYGDNKIRYLSDGSTDSI